MAGDQHSAAFDDPLVGPPTDTDVTSVRDVIVCINDATVEIEVEEFQQHLPPGTPGRPLREGSPPVDLGRGVRLDRLSDDDANLVMNACSPRGHYFVPVRQFGQRCAYIREVNQASWSQHIYSWDPDGVLWDALALSRLVRDNAHSTEYAARIVEHQDGEKVVIYTLGAESKHVYRVRRSRDWLDASEAQTLRALLQAYWQVEDEIPARVKRAAWRAEYASWVKWGDLTVPILVGGIESLLKTERHQATTQFVTRAPRLAETLGIQGITPELCDRLYDARSDWIHGAHVRLYTTGLEAAEAGTPQGPQDADQWEVFADIALLQDLLRAAVRRAFEDWEFRRVFEDDAAIRNLWAG